VFSSALALEGNWPERHWTCESHC